MKAIRFLAVVLVSVFLVCGAAHAENTFIKIFDDPVVKTYTMSFFGFRYVTTYETVNWLQSKVLARRSLTHQIYNRDLLMYEYGQTYQYGSDGKPAGALYLNNFYSYYTYNSDKKLVSSIYVNSFYNEKYQFQNTQQHIITNSYNADGTLKETKDVFKMYGARNKVLESWSTLDKYTYCANGDSYREHFYYDGTGKLRSRSADITIVTSSGSKKYGVYYSVDETGNISYTHTYENNGSGVVIGPSSDIASASGQGYKSLTDIVKALDSFAMQDGQIIVDGDIKFNSDKTWDFGKLGIQVSGNMSIAPDTNGYDVYVNGNLTIKGTVDFSNRKVYVNGNLLVERDAKFMVGDLSINFPGSITLPINSGSIITGTSGTISGATTVGGDLTAGDKISVLSSGTIQLPQGVSLTGSMATKSDPLGAPAPSAK